MPTLNKTLINGSKWKDDLYGDMDALIDEACHPLQVEDLYPLIDLLDPETLESTQIRRPAPHQMLLHNLNKLPISQQPKFVMLSGAYGSGKTTNICADHLWRLKNYPGYCIWVVAPYDWFFIDTFLPAWRAIIDDDDPFIVKKNLTAKQFWFANGSFLACKAFDDPAKIKGFEAHQIHLFEASELMGGNKGLMKQAWSALLGRLRAKDNAALGIKFPRRIILEQNPTRGHNLWWEIFIKGNPTSDVGMPFLLPPDAVYPDGFKCDEFRKQIGDDIYYTISSGTSSNPNLPKGYIESQTAHLDDEMKKRVIDGKFASTNAMIYMLPYYSRATHIIDEQVFLDYWGLRHNLENINVDEFFRESSLFDQQAKAMRFLRFCSAIPPSWKVIVGVDPAGLASPYAIEFYLETEEDMHGDRHYICFAEIYKRGMTTRQIINECVKPMMKHLPSQIEFYGDPHYSMQKSSPDGMSIRDAWEDEGIVLNMPKGYNKAGSIQFMQEMMRRDHSKEAPYHEDIQDDEDGSPSYMQYSVGCARLYYLGFRGDMNKLQPYAVANLAEKDVWRYQPTKVRESNEGEEGLSQVRETRPVDSDDHAQTAEIFAFIGYRPIPHGNYAASPYSNGGAFNYGRKSKQRRRGA